MDKIQLDLLSKVADLHKTPEGAYNIRANGALGSRNTTANVDIVSKTDKDGIDIIIKPYTKNESVHIPVIISQSGLEDMVYNDFYIGEGADVTIVAGCGIHNCGTDKSQHDGIHTFHVGKGAKIKYVERHYGEGDGNGENVMNPTNVGAIFRSAAALNIDAVLLTPASSNPLYRRAARVSMGTVFQIPWTYLAGDEAAWPHPGIDVLKKLGFKTAAMALCDESVSIDDEKLMAEEKLAIILGTEGDGLATATIADCDYTLKIPMSHGVDSLNVAAASAIAFWELGKK
jgi:tRNA(Leu) C34 or U34 (ribose-2'-O)-methylase TrmL